MSAILKDMGIEEFEPRVVSQLMEFSYRFVSNVLDDAKAVSTHANPKKKVVDVDDVKLAVEMYCEQNLTNPPSREILLDMARKKNAQPLPVPRPAPGVRLPPERQCITACNYRLKFKPKSAAMMAGMTAGAAPQGRHFNYGVNTGPQPKIVSAASIKSNQGFKSGYTGGVPIVGGAQVVMQPGMSNVQIPGLKVNMAGQPVAVKRKADDLN